MEPISEVSELFRHQRAVRAFSDREVSDEIVEQVLTAATHGPSGSNTQPWRWIVVRDAEVKAQLSEEYEAAFAAAYADRAPARADDRQPFTEVPVLIVPCVQVPSTGRTGIQTGASIYPACQNLMLQARALGLDPGDAAENDNRAVEHAKRAFNLGGEINVSRRINKVD